ncbi:MAG: SDR family NAD(P)-dependent oxidoreductase [Candidatus Hodarchaeales archaeon]|jgi:NAD(P)-dependent dehydrogenase (short-subunit alcohol dehydrogenase family)
MNNQKIKSSTFLSLETRVAVITGGAAGIGLSTAKLLAKMGATIALLDVNESRGHEAIKEIRKIGVQAKFYLCDVTKDTQCQKTVAAIVNDFERIDILFNNAGVIVRKNAVELQENEWDLVINVNLKAIFLLSRHVLPIMIKQGNGGSIVNTGSGWGLKGGPNAVAYCAAKGGVVNMTRAMAIDHGKHEIRVNCICPGDTDTELLRGEAVQLNQDMKEFMEEAAERPLKRVGRPLDIAHTVLYLVSDLSSWVTGTTIVVDGGGIA